MNVINNERITPPNKAYDSEYATQFRREMEFLKRCGIEPTYVKKVGEYRIPTYKYTKTPELFKHVAAFYEQYRNEKTYNALEAAVRAASEIDIWAQPLSH